MKLPHGRTVTQHIYVSSHNYPISPVSSACSWLCAATASVMLSASYTHTVYVLLKQEVLVKATDATLILGL